MAKLPPGAADGVIGGKTRHALQAWQKARALVPDGYLSVDMVERLRTEITHPIFGYRVTYRRCLELQARLLGKALSGEIADYPPFVVR